jgi:hypothetical protein
MGQLSRILRHGRGGGGDGQYFVSFYCPGCKSSHTVYVEPGSHYAWQWNRNADRPTFAPSILIRTGHHIPGEAGKRCWCTYNAEQRAKGKRQSTFKCGVCHSYVREGQIEFLADCTHALAGQTVALPPLPKHMRD